MSAPRIDADPSRPFQREGSLVAIWLPRGRGRDDRAAGLLCALRVCANPGCNCTEAKVSAIPVDDRLRWAKLHQGHITTKWWDTHDPTMSHQLTLDFVTGEVTHARGGELPEDVRPFFREPVPAWLLDDIYAEWAAARPVPDAPWHDRVLESWAPGDMLCLFDADPTRRPDTYVRDGRSYVVDFFFCVAPGCDCTANRFVVLAIEETPDETRWSEIGSFELDPGMTPCDLKGPREHVPTLSALYLDWRARSGNPEERFAELRAHTRERGALLHDLARSRRRERAPVLLPARASWPSALPVVAGASAPGRNAPCPCGSGKKFKRCCGSSGAAQA